MLGQADAGSARPAWRLALLPSFALLGVALPLWFLTSTEQYLYYLRPLELIPTYGTAWLLLAAPALPLSVICWLILIAFNRHSTRIIHGATVSLLIGTTTATVVGALVYDFVVWLRTFGMLVTTPGSKGAMVVWLGAAVLAFAAIIAVTGRGRAILLKLCPPAEYGTLLGALSVVTLPFCGWTDTFATLNPAAYHLAAVPKPHILLVTIDALSAEHMSLYGATRETTPRLDAFAHEAITFDHAYANGNFTTPSTASILTATRPWTHRSLQLVSWPVPDVRRNSLPALLRLAGYQTGYVATNPLAGAARNGFGAYFNFRSSDRVPSVLLCGDRLSILLRYHCAATSLPPFSAAELLRQFITFNRDNRHYDPRLAMQPALEWLIAVDKRTPIFLWVHFLPPHSPYAAPKPWLGEFDSSLTARSGIDSETAFAFPFGRVPKQRAAVLEARYDESIKYVDSYVGEFLQRALHLLGPNTAVVVTADHGESFAHGYGGHGGPCLFESLIHIPLLVKLPYENRDARISAQAEQVDIAPTLAQLAGIGPPPSWEGRSLLELVRSSQMGAPAPVKPAFAMNFEENPRRSKLVNGSVAVVDGRWKLVHFMGALHYPLMPQLHDELFDVAADPQEVTNRISDEPAEADRLRELITSKLVEHAAALP